MNTKILGRLTPKMVKDFIRNLQQKGYVRKGFFRVKDVSYFYTRKFEIKFWLFSKEYFVFETTGNTFSFMNVNKSQSLSDIWLIFLINKFGYDEVVEENDRIIYLKDVAFSRGLVRVDCMNMLGPGYIARDVMIDKDIVKQEFSKGENLIVTGHATGYHEGVYGSNMRFYSAPLTELRTSSVITDDNYWILIDNLVRNPKDALASLQF